MAELSLSLWLWTNFAEYHFSAKPFVGAQSHVVRGLIPLMEYNTTLSFYNWNTNLKDFCNQTIKVITLPIAPSINVSDVGERRMRIQFVPKLNPDSVHLINTAVATDAAGTGNNCSVSASTLKTSCDIESLRSGTEYSVRARTCIGMHCSVDSPVITVKTLIEASPSEEETTTTMSETTPITTPSTDPTPVPTATPSEDKSTASTNPTPEPTATPSEDSDNLNAGIIIIRINQINKNDWNTDAFDLRSEYDPPEECFNLNVYGKQQFTYVL
ncbi:hypothetical protein AAHC03_022783 [Spirometra sp. Aus1]